MNIIPSGALCDFEIMEDENAHDTEIAGEGSGESTAKEYDCVYYRLDGTLPDDCYRLTENPSKLTYNGHTGEGVACSTPGGGT